jgi:hypothetical protein
MLTAQSSPKCGDCGDALAGVSFHMTSVLLALTSGPRSPTPKMFVSLRGDGLLEQS